MARINIPQGPGAEAVRVFSLHPAMGMALAGVSAAIYEKSLLSKREREAVRMRIALINQCQICLGFRFPELQAEGINEEFYRDVSDWRASDAFSQRERLAIEYAERFATDHLNIDDAFVSRLRDHFSDAEIFDLSGVIAGLLANGRILQVLQVDQSCAIDMQSLQSE